MDKITPNFKNVTLFDIATGEVILQGELTVLKSEKCDVKKDDKYIVEVKSEDEVVLKTTTSSIEFEGNNIVTDSLIFEDVEIK